MLPSLTREEKIRIEVEGVVEEIKYLRGGLDHVVKIAKKENLNYPLVSIKHLQTHIEQLNRLIQTANNEIRDEQEQIAQQLISLGHL